MHSCKKVGMTAVGLTGLVGLAVALFVAGCKARSPDQTQAAQAAQPAADGETEEEADIRAARAELSPKDQRLVAAQEFCAVMPAKRLGVMGLPLKVMVKDQPVFLCCKGCRRKALADPDKTLAMVEELKAKVKAASANK